MGLQNAGLYLTPFTSFVMMAAAKLIQKKKRFRPFTTMFFDLVLFYLFFLAFVAVSRAVRFSTLESLNLLATALHSRSHFQMRKSDDRE